MPREARAILLVLAGAALLHLSVFGDGYLRYVRPGMHPYLIAAGVVLLGLGLTRAFLLFRALLASGDQANGDQASSDQASSDLTSDDQRQPGSASDPHAPSHLRAAWLLLLPLVAVFVAAPPALGDFTARQSGNTVAKPVATGFPALPAGDPLTLPLADFVVRAVWDQQDSLRGRHVELTGFVLPKAGGGWYLTRLTITCCAADAVTYKVEVRGTTAVPRRGAWVRVTGSWQPDGRAGRADDVPIVAVTAVVGIPAPADPYE
ncbi:putative repeat protein (TIGR03943 family) [Streptacidiphilus sp. MAP12-20]|uniref:TIGR03943 family putative permease subunit n=1 Tax=Streptacidiphilus sp. MAP12-20 TaxID=3156299 RepID=UPI003516E194